MAEVNSTQASAQAGSRSTKELLREANENRQPPPVKQKVKPNIPEEDRVDIGKRVITKRNVTEESRRVDDAHAKQVKKENPPIQSPPQNPVNINLSTRQEPQGIERPPQVDSKSIRTVIQVAGAKRREPNVVEQQIIAARSAGARPKPLPGQTEAKQAEASATIQVRQEQRQGAGETELRRSPAAVQTQKGQNVDKLT